MEQTEPRPFYVHFREEQGIFLARIYNPNGRDSLPVHIAHDLEELLKKCREDGLAPFVGLTEDAIDFINDWRLRIKPALQYVENIWQGESTASRTIGFRLPHKDE